MGHPEVGTSGQVEAFDPHTRDGVTCFRVFSLSEERMREEQLHNMSIQFHRALGLDTDQLDEEERRFTGALASLSEKVFAERSIVDRLTGIGLLDKAQLYTCFVRTEPAPSASNLGGTDRRTGCPWHAESPPLLFGFLRGNC
ncbi:MAG: hypothetical protein U5K31_02945 [Balneolaceae bacterium]|nr:hypothetical protein [Balneolaceae bacterium]